MVSTRQMATSSGSNSAANPAEESIRLSVVTRQSSSHDITINYPTVSSQQMPLQRAAVGSTRQEVKANVISTATGGTNTGNNIDHTTTELNLLDLPTEILSSILSYVGYKKVAQLRLVSQKFNGVCMHILNSTFSKLIKRTFTHFHAIKSNMPRRESARRNHPLACECDIIETCHMRLSLLQMTFGKHIERGHCCFFPGAILDEVYTILHYIRNTPRLERPYRVTDELFDLSTMAMEYFRDRIEQLLPDIAYFNKDFFKLSTNPKRPALVVSSDLSDNSASLPSPPQSNMVLRKGIRKIKQGMRIYNNQLSVLRNELRTCKRKSSEQGKQIAEQQKLLAEQQKQTVEYANRLDENDKKNEEISRKFSTLLQELNKCKTELQYWRSKSPAIPTCTSCGQKVTPVLPQEDYQALINQGVKPDDIILNINDDTDVESDASISENNLAHSNEFVFPDQTTTAKLLAVNTASKQLKRQHNSICGETITNNESHGSVSNSKTMENNDAALTFVDDCNEGNIGRKTLEVFDCIHFECMPTGSEQQNDDVAAAPSHEIVNKSSMSDGEDGDRVVCGYSTKLFYGTNVHKSVIVSPSMLIKSEPSISECNNDRNEIAAEICHAALNGLLDNTNTTRNVVSLQNISAHETKKARRVQKTTRCLNVSGKRSK